MDSRILSPTYLADGAPMVDEPTVMSGDRERSMAGAQPGQPIETPLNLGVSHAESTV